MFQNRDDAAYAMAEVGYRDGSPAHLPIQYRRQVWDFWTCALTIRTPLLLAITLESVKTE